MGVFIKFIGSLTSFTVEMNTEPRHEKTVFSCKNKGADQLCVNCTADKPLSFHYIV